MILSVILGTAVDTSMWIAKLQKEYADHIIVVDYESVGESELRDDILYLSPNEAKNYMEKFDSVEFYTAFYSFPNVRENKMF